MIHYSLRCGSDHAFDGWFKDSGGFERQVQAGLVACPECGGTDVNRALMAPAIGRKGRVVDPAGMDQGVVPGRSREVSTSEGPKTGAVLPDQVRAMLMKLRLEVEKNCEHVGDRFAQVARAIHNGEGKARSIYGEATPEQAESLAEDGIEIARIPWVPRADG